MLMIVGKMQAGQYRHQAQTLEQLVRTEVQQMNAIKEEIAAKEAEHQREVHELKADIQRIRVSTALTV
jgi:hypothetical protein